MRKNGAAPSPWASSSCPPRLQQENLNKHTPVPIAPGLFQISVWRAVPADSSSLVGRQLSDSFCPSRFVTAVQISVCRSVWGCGLPRRHFMPPRNDIEIWWPTALKLVLMPSKITVIANQSADWCGNPFSSINSNLYYLHLITAPGVSQPIPPQAENSS